MVDEVALIARRMMEEGEKTQGFFAAFSAADWSKRVYDDGDQWDVRQVLCHLVNAEEEFNLLLGDVLAGGPGAPEGYDILAHNTRAVNAMVERQPDDLMAAFSAARARNITLVESLTAADLEKVGNHPFFGPSSMEKMAKLVYRHTMMHERDIRRVMAAEQG